MMEEHVFVYGTLKKGQCREHCWPIQPRQVQAAWTYGSLFDLGPYPALLDGTDRVLGELWSFAVDDMPRVLQVLDQVEGTNQAGQANEYDRRPVRVDRLDQLSDGKQAKSWVAETYFYAQTHLLRSAQRLPARFEHQGQSYVIWLPSQTPTRAVR